jgi:hypothetical protein
LFDENAEMGRFDASFFSESAYSHAMLAMHPG